MKLEFRINSYGAYNINRENENIWQLGSLWKKREGYVYNPGNLSPEELRQIADKLEELKEVEVNLPFDPDKLPVNPPSKVTPIRDEPEE